MGRTECRTELGAFLERGRSLSPDCFLTLRSLTHSLTQVDGENACQDEEKKTKKTKEREQDKSEEEKPKKKVSWVAASKARTSMAAQEQEQRPRRLVWHIPNAALTDVAGSLSHMPASLSHMPTPNDT